MKSRSSEERFRNKTDTEKSMVFWNGSRCHEWTGWIAPNGYGHFRIDGKTIYTHRAAWEFANGPIPDGFHVMHGCDNRACVNLKHLRVGTRADNMADMTAKNRQAWGARSSHAKLTAKDIEAIRASSDLQAVLAKRYGITQGHVSTIKSNRTWRYLDKI